MTINTGNKMNKKVIISVSVGVVVAVTALIYFVAVPSVQVGSYKDVVGTKQSELNDSLNKLGAILESDTFVKADVEAGTVRSDVKKGLELAKNVEAKIALVKKDLTTFNAIPLLDFNEKYKTAKLLQDDEKAYISKSEAFVFEMKQVLAYYDKGADLNTKLIEFEFAMEKASEVESLAEYAAVNDKAIQNLQPAIDAATKQTPPVSLKESHDYSVKAFAEFIELCKQLSVAARADDVERLETIIEKLTAKNEEMTKKLDDYNAKFIRESELRKLDDALNQLDREISQKQASL